MDTPDHEDIENVVAEGAPTAGRREWMGLAVLALPCLLYSMDFTVLHLAVPHLSADLKPTSSQLLWIVDIYGFLLAGFLITIGTLGDRIGRRRLLLVGAAAFGAASLLAAFSRSAEMDLLAFACEEHTNGGVGPDPTVGVCWDADRLNLWRVGIRPDPRWLSTEAARSVERIAWARDLQWERLSWEELCQSFGLR